MSAKQNTQTVQKWMNENTDLIRIHTRKSDQIPQRIQQAIDTGLSKSRQSYIIEAVKQRLAADGIPEPKPSAPPEGTP